MAKKEEAPKQLWQRKRPVGRPALFEKPEDMKKLADEYFDWCDKTPFFEHKVFQHQGEIVNARVEKPRAYTMAGLCSWAGMSVSGYGEYANKPEFSGVYADIMQKMTEQKLAGASAGIFNAAIVARDLGLTDKQDVTSGGKQINQWVINPVTTDKDGSN